MKWRFLIFLISFLIILNLLQGFVTATPSEEICKSVFQTWTSQDGKPICEWVLDYNNLENAIQNKNATFCEKILQFMKESQQYKDKTTGYEYSIILRNALTKECKTYFIELTGDANICKGIFQRNETFKYSNDILGIIDSSCITSVAIKQKNLSILNYYFGNYSTYNQSRYPVVSIASWSQKDFENFTNLNQCETKWDYPNSACTFWLNKKNGLETNCDNLRSLEFRETCLRYNSQFSKNVTPCLNMSSSNKWECIIKYVKEVDDLSACNYLDNNALVYNCIDYHARYHKNLRSCDLINESSYRLNCIGKTPFSFRLNQIPETIILIIPLSVLFFFLAFKRKISENLKIKDYVFSILFLGIYVFSLIILFITGIWDSSLVFTIINSIISIPIYLFLKILSILENLLYPFPYFQFMAKSIYNFLILGIYFFIFPFFLKVKSKKLKVIILILISLIIIISIICSIWDILMMRALSHI